MTFWGYCDKCNSDLKIGDACWAEKGKMNQALTFCVPCWQSSPLCSKQPDDSEYTARNVVLFERRGPDAISACSHTITDKD